MREFIQFFLWCVECFFVLYMIGYASFLFLSVTVGSSELYAGKRRSRLHSELAGDHYVPVSLIVPAYNEGVTIASTIRSLLALDYSLYEIIVVDDGSSDDTAQTVIDTFDLHAVVDESLAELNARMEALNLTARVTGNGKVSADPKKIYELVNNLLSNALKFTDRGDSVSVEVSQMTQNEYLQYKIVVSDTGIGMSPEFLKTIFEPYSRESRMVSRPVSGTGLGMPIVKSLVELLNGSIVVDSTPGKGTVFTLILPFLMVRREEDGIRRYVHLGTGNYNDSTAKLYTDCGLLTCNPQIGEDATAVFNMLSGYSEPLKWNQLVVAPIWLRKRFMRMIQRETNYAREGRPARIIAKVNSLCDKEIIAALYEASCAGVKIDLIIRGICCLRAGVPNLSENIAVRSIVGNFLEHSRIFYFENDGYPEIYMGSADWMPRNLDRRVEIMFPILDEKLKEKAMHILNVQLSDNLKAHVLGPDGIYNKIDRRGKAAIGAQDTFCKEAVEAVKAASEEVDPVNLRVFIPAESVEH